MMGRGRAVCQLTFGHPSASAAVRALDPQAVAGARRCLWNPALVRRLLAYAAGRPVDFRDVKLDPGPLTAFQRRVLRACHGIPYGETLSYGQLAARAGFPGAARAVGNCMAGNRIPILIPCHRVVRAGGSVGAYSAPGGTRTKRRLLALEAGSA